MGDIVERLLILLHLHLTLVAGIIERIVGAACHERVVEVVVFESQAKLSLSVKQLGARQHIRCREVRERFGTGHKGAVEQSDNVVCGRLQLCLALCSLIEQFAAAYVGLCKIHKHVISLRVVAL